MFNIKYFFVYNKSLISKYLIFFFLNLILLEFLAFFANKQLEKKAVFFGHDWGGMVAWNFAMVRPEMTERLIVLNLPHPKALSRELANNPDQQRNSQYARDFQKPNSHKYLNAEKLTSWVKDKKKRKK